MTNHRKPRQRGTITPHSGRSFDLRETCDPEPPAVYPVTTYTMTAEDYTRFNEIMRQNKKRATCKGGEEKSSLLV